MALISRLLLPISLICLATSFAADPPTASKYLFEEEVPLDSISIDSFRAPDENPTEEWLTATNFTGWKELKVRRCGRKLVKFITTLCSGQAAKPTLMDVANVCCADACDLATLKKELCPYAPEPIFLVKKAHHHHHHKRHPKTEEKEDVDTVKDV